MNESAGERRNRERCPGWRGRDDALALVLTQ